MGLFTCTAGRIFAILLHYTSCRLGALLVTADVIGDSPVCCQFARLLDFGFVLLNFKIIYFVSKFKKITFSAKPMLQLLYVDLSR